MVKRIVLVTVFAVCLLAASSGAFGAWYIASVTKSGSGNVVSDSIVSNDTGFDITVSSNYKTVTSEVYFRKTVGSSWTIIPRAESQLVVEKGQTKSKFLNHKEGNYYRLKLRNWGHGSGTIEVHDH